MENFDINDDGHFDDTWRSDQAAKYLRRVHLFTQAIVLMSDRLSDLYELVDSEEEVDEYLGHLFDLEEALNHCMSEVRACMGGLFGFDEEPPDDDGVDLELSILNMLDNLDNLDKDLVFDARKKRYMDILRDRYGFGW